MHHSCQSPLRLVSWSSILGSYGFHSFARVLDLGAATWLPPFEKPPCQRVTIDCIDPVWSGTAIHSHVIALRCSFLSLFSTLSAIFRRRLLLLLLFLLFPGSSLILGARCLLEISFTRSFSHSLQLPLFPLLLPNLNHPVINTVWGNRVRREAGKGSGQGLAEPLAEF